MKRTLALLFTVASVLSFAFYLFACENRNEEEDAPQSVTLTHTEKKTENMTAPDSESCAGSENTDKPEAVFTVCIDAGHQAKGISEKEPNGPGSSVMKAKLSSGTRGVVTKIPEYVLTLEVSLMLKEELLLRGYRVVMIRETHDCPKSNAERAEIANNSGADVFVRIHANGSNDQSVSGVLACAPTESNEFLPHPLVLECRRLSLITVNELCSSTGAKNRGIYNTDTMTGINWCKIPVTIVEMGYMSNPEEDLLMATEEYRIKIVNGIANGIDSFFGLK